MRSRSILEHQERRHGDRSIHLTDRSISACCAVLFGAVWFGLVSQIMIGQHGRLKLDLM